MNVHVCVVGVSVCLFVVWCVWLVCMFTSAD